MPFEVFVALRYLRNQRTQTVLIVSGIGVGVGVMIFLSALITGLQESLIDRTLGSQAHVVVRPPEETPRVLPARDGALRAVTVERSPQRVRSIDGWREIEAQIRGMPGLVGVAPTVSGPAIALRGQGSVTVSVRGVEPDSYRTVVDVERRLVQGRLDLTSAQAVVGIELARTFGLAIGGRLRLQAAGDRGGIYTVSGIFDYNSVTLNETLVFVSLRAAQTLLGLDEGVSSLELAGEDIFAAERTARRIEDRTGLDAESWMTRNGDLLAGLRSQTLSSVMIQLFVILAVALGIASVLAVSVVQRSREIGILRATGTQSRAVTRIFLVQGAVLGAAGSLLGTGIGTSLALLFSSLARNPDGTATFPVALTGELYVRAVAIAMVVGLAAAALPAWDAKRLDPATVIRDG